MADKKQEWVYTEDGPELDTSQPPKKPKVKLRKSYFVLPWILLPIAIIWTFAQGGVGGTLGGIILIILAPALAITANALTFYFLALRPMRKYANQKARQRR